MEKHHVDRDLIWKKETRVQVDDRCSTAAVRVFCPQMLCYIWTPCWRWRTSYVPTEPANFWFSARLTWMMIEWFNRSGSPNFIGQNVSSYDSSDHFAGVVMLKIMYPLFYIRFFQNVSLWGKSVFGSQCIPWRKQSVKPGMWISDKTGLAHETIDVTLLATQSPIEDKQNNHFETNKL